MEDRELSEVLEALYLPQANRYHWTGWQMRRRRRGRVARVLEEMRARPRARLLVTRVAGAGCFARARSMPPFITRLLRVQPTPLAGGAGDASHYCLPAAITGPG